jgi:hypothetical protein
MICIVKLLHFLLSQPILAFQSGQRYSSETSYLSKTTEMTYLFILYIEDKYLNLVYYDTFPKFQSGCLKSAQLPISLSCRQGVHITSCFHEPLCINDLFPFWVYHSVGRPNGAIANPCYSRDFSGGLSFAN